MATDPTIPFQYLPFGQADSAKTGANFEAFLKYIRDRNDGTASWDSLSVTGNITLGGNLIGSATSSFFIGTGVFKGLDIIRDGDNSLFGRIFNTRTSSDSDSIFIAQVGGTSAGDSKMRFTDGTNLWEIGKDISDSNKFKISASTLGTSDVFSATLAGEITQPLQPSFLVTNGTGATDVTGDATDYTVLWPTEIYDQGSDFASNTFTAPVTGRYLLTAAAEMDNILITHQFVGVQIVTSNRTYWNANNFLIARTFDGKGLSVISDMDAGDTATVHILVSGSTKTIDISADATRNFFSGSLIN